MTTAREDYDPSAASIRPLLETFWSPTGWRDPHNWPAAPELTAAVERGVMFSDPVVLDHDGWVAAARAAVDRVTPEEVEAAFIASLTSRRLDLRSALASYVIAHGLPDHSFDATSGTRRCAMCGLYAEAAADDLNVLNFERFKWGGIRRDDLRYVAFDLQQFLRAPRPDVRRQDVVLGRAVLKALAELPGETTAPQAAKLLRLPKGTAAERGVLLDILGVCGILATPDHPGYSTRFVPVVERDLPSYHFVEHAYPACWWKASAGLDNAALEQILPNLA